MIDLYNDQRPHLELQNQVHPVLSEWVYIIQYQCSDDV